MIVQDIKDKLNLIALMFTSNLKNPAYHEIQSSICKIRKIVNSISHVPDIETSLNICRNC